MLASSMAPLRARNILASASIDWRQRRDTHWANRFQWPGGSSDWGPSAQYSAITFLRSSSWALSATISSIMAERSGRSG